jgi:hypothetical protein
MNWEQFRAILWLRWRLTQNQLKRGGSLGAVIGALAVVALVVFAVGAGVGATVAGALAMKDVSAMVVMYVWDGVVFVVLFFSFLGVLTELQRSESIDLARLLHLPISLTQVFVFNYLVSLVSLGTVVGLAVMLGLAMGLTIGRGPQFLLAIPLAVTFLFMVTAWFYYLRGWLLSLMVNPRRRRNIIMGVTLAFILVTQLPQLIPLVMQRKARAERAARRATQKQQADTQTRDNQPRTAPLDKVQQQQQVEAIVIQVNTWVPLLWLPNGARGLATREVLPAVWGGVGMFALGWFGLSRAYRATVRFYRVDERVKPATAKTPSPKSAKPPRNWVEQRLPWVPEDIAALAMAQFRSMTRAPEVRMILAMGLFMSIFLPAMILWRGGAALRIPDPVKPFIATCVVVMTLFSLLQLMCNQFGSDRDGFRGLVLLPTPRHRLLFGKNLAVLPLAAAIEFVSLAALAVLAKLSVFVVFATVLQFGAAFLLFCMVGNLSSILVPYRIAAGSLKPTKQSWQAVLMMMAVHMLFPLAVAPIAIPPLLGWVAERFGGLPAAAVNLCAALVMVVIFAFLYAQTLRPLGRLLQRRETNILRAVTEVLE